VDYTGNGQGLLQGRACWPIAEGAQQKGTPDLFFILRNMDSPQI